MASIPRLPQESNPQLTQDELLRWFLPKKPSAEQLRETCCMDHIPARWTCSVAAIGCMGSPIQNVLTCDSNITFIEHGSSPFASQPGVTREGDFLYSSNAASTQWVIAIYHRRCVVGHTNDNQRLMQWIRSRAAFAADLWRRHHQLCSMVMFVPPTSPCRVEQFMKWNHTNPALPALWRCHTFVLHNTLHSGPIDTGHQVLLCAPQ